MSVQEPWPIVVFGAPRSGTTYLNTILNTHPEVYVTHETRVFTWMWDALRNRTQEERLVKTHRIKFVPYAEEALPDLVRGFYRMMRPRARYWGDKNPFYSAPDNVEVLSTVAELFPGARFIHIIRDGRDVVTSLLRKHDQEGDPWTNLRDANRVWTGTVDHGVAFGQSRREAGDYLEMKFEDLIADDLGMAKRVFSFLGIEMAEETVAFCEQQRRERTPISGPTTAPAAIGLSQWQQALDVEEQIVCLQLSGRHLVQYGYETEESLAALWASIADLG